MAFIILAWLNRIRWLCVSLWQYLLSYLLRGARHWRDVPEGHVEALLAPLRETTRRSYRQALWNFHHWIVANRKVLDTTEDVNVALRSYITTTSRQKGKNLFAALEKCYPPLKHALPWSKAYLNVIRITNTHDGPNISNEAGCYVL